MLFFHLQFIMAMMCAIAVPNFVQARKSSQRNACIDNMRQIEGAVEQAKMEGIAAPGPNDIYGADKYIKVPPVCPSSKQPYSLKGTGDVDWRPVCPNPTIDGKKDNERHELPGLN